MTRTLAFLLALLFAEPAMAALAIDGKAHAHIASGTTLGLSLSTTQSSDVVIVALWTTQGPIVSVTSPHLTFARRVSYQFSTNPHIEEWYAIASGPLSAEAITVTLPASGIATADAFGVSGANTAAPFDANVSLPATAGGGANPVVSTSNANDMILGSFDLGPVATSTPGTGFTLVNSADYQTVEYMVVSSTQTSLTVSQSATSNSAFADAIQAAPIGGTTQPIIGGGVGTLP